MTISECEQKAVECLRLARVMKDNTNQALLRQMALAWVERANQIKRSVRAEAQVAEPLQGAPTRANRAA